MRLIDDWARFDQCPWKLLLASCAVVSALVSVERAHFQHQAYGVSYFVMYQPKVIN